MNITKFPCDDCKTQNTYYACDQSSCEKHKEYKKLKDVKPIYIELAQIAFDTVLQTMIEGEQSHPANNWRNISTGVHYHHVFKHLSEWGKGDTSELHLDHAITRLAMIKYLEDSYDKTD